MRINSPNEMVALDFAEFPESTTGFRYVLVLIDHFTKWVLLSATQNRTSASVAQALAGWVSLLGPPERFLSDNAPEFTAGFSRWLTSKFNNRWTFCSPYHPEGNGLAEAAVKRLKKTAKAVIIKWDEWEKYLDDIQWGMNTTVSDTTGHTPHELLFGFEPPSTMSHLFSTVVDGIERRREAIRTVRDSAAIRTLEAQDRAARVRPEAS